MTKKSNAKDDEAKKRKSGDLLKNVDKLLKTDDYRGALDLIEQALEIDPGNFYARAYKDRIMAQLEHLDESIGEGYPKDQADNELKQKIHAEQHRAEEEQKRQDADHQRGETELRRRAQEVESRRLQEEDTRRQFEEERRKRETESKKKLEEERKRLEAETKKRVEAERMRLLEESRKREELGRLKAEEETRRRAEEEERKRKEEVEEQERRRMEEERRQREMEERRRADEEAKRRLEEELRKRLEAERIRKREEQMIAAAREEGRQQAVQQKIVEFLNNAKEKIAQQNAESASFEVQKILLLDPDHSDAIELEQMIQSQEQNSADGRLGELGVIPRSFFTDLFKNGAKIAWKDGTPTEELQTLLSELNSFLSITQEENRSATALAKTEVYSEAMYAAWQDGTLSPLEVKHLEMLRNELPITADDHLAIELSVRKKLGY